MRPPPGLGAGEYITRVRWEYGQAAAGMQPTARPMLAGRVTNPDNQGGLVVVGDTHKARYYAELGERRSPTLKLTVA